MKERRKHFSRPDLVERGWTQSLINHFLGEPDQLIRNPVYRSASPMKLYECQRVETIESSQEFMEMIEKARLRKASAQKSAETKRRKIRQRVKDGFAIRLLPGMAEDEFIEKVCTSYNEWHAEAITKGNKAKAMPSAPKEFLLRISLNYIRHECSNYDRFLERLQGQVGVDEARFLMHQKTRKWLKAQGFETLSEEFEKQEAQIRQENWSFHGEWSSEHRF